MTNYEAILRMTPARLAAFLDDVTLTGINTGMYAAGLPEEEATEVLDESPFDEEWLRREAEGATLSQTDPDGELILSEALTRAIFRLAGIEDPDEG